MIRISIARALIDNIPEAYFDTRSPIATKKVWKSVVQQLPEIKVDWKSDVWDLNPYMTLSSGSRNILHFCQFDSSVKDYIKAYVIYMIDRRLKLSTIKGRLNVLQCIWMNISRKKGYVSIFQINTDDFVEHVWGKMNETMTAGSISISNMMEFLTFLQEEHNIWIPIDHEKIEEMRRYCVDTRPMIKSRRKYADVPDALYKPAIQMYNDVMRDHSQPYNTRMVAGMMLIASQTGLRASDLMAIDTDPIRYLDTERGELPYLKYHCLKIASNGAEATDVVNICTPLAERTISYLQELRKQCPTADRSGFLCVLNTNMRKKGKGLDKPASTERLNTLNRILFVRNLRPLAEKDWHGIRRVTTGLKSDRGKTFSVPSVHNYRVHFATALTHQGMPLDFVECLLAHTFEQMDIGGYCREDISAERRDAAWNMLESPDFQNIIEEIIYERGKRITTDTGTDETGGKTRER